MTEEEWLACADPLPMLQFLRDTGSSRKLRLFGCGACRRIWHLLTQERSRVCVETAERYADGQAGPFQLREAERNAAKFRWKGGTNEEYSAAAAAAGTAYPPNFDPDVVYASDVAANAAGAADKSEERAAQCDLLRDIFGNPFRSVACDPAWLTDTVAALAKGIYDERAFDRMPILADALQDAGCNEPAILEHCRGAKLAHVRGCWVVDLLLGKA
jgi:hypothetical protein